MIPPPICERRNRIRSTNILESALFLLEADDTLLRSHKAKNTHNQPYSQVWWLKRERERERQHSVTVKIKEGGGEGERKNAFILAYTLRTLHASRLPLPISLPAQVHGRQNKILMAAAEGERFSWKEREMLSIHRKNRLFSEKECDREKDRIIIVVVVIGSQICSDRARVFFS